MPLPWVQGVLCGDCLYARYGEHVEEAAANKSEPGLSWQSCQDPHAVAPRCIPA
jgi:hypothetical protein